MATCYTIEQFREELLTLLIKAHLAGHDIYDECRAGVDNAYWQAGQPIQKPEGEQ